MYVTSVRYVVLATLLMFCRPSVAQEVPFEVQSISPGVYAVIRTDTPGLMFEANSAFLVGVHHVIVIDGGSNPESARQVLAAIRSITDRPVRYVINTHWHDDHVLGNQVYQAAFPGIDFVALEQTRIDMATVGQSGRKRFIESAPQSVRYLQTLMAENKGISGGTMSTEERQSHETSIQLANHYLDQSASFDPVLPTLTFTDSLTLFLDGKTLQLRYLGRAHTRGDLVVYIPEERLVFAGDLVSLPAPLVGTTSFPIDYSGTLRSLLGLNPAVIVPGHGPVLRDTSYVNHMLDLLDDLADQVRQRVREGATLETIHQQIDLQKHRRIFAGEQVVSGILFDQYVTQPAVQRAFEQLTGVNP